MKTNLFIQADHWSSSMYYIPWLLIDIKVVMISDPNGLKLKQKAESLFLFTLSKTRKCTKEENHISRRTKSETFLHIYRRKCHLESSYIKKL